MDALEQLKLSIIAQMKRHVPVQTLWATCKSTDMEEGTMVAEAGGAEYYDVLLGLGGHLVEPQPNSRVLLGLVNNSGAACFLLYAEQVKQQRINGDKWGGLVKSDVVSQVDTSIIANVNALKAAVSSWTPSGTPAADIASLKTIMTTWANSTLTATPKESYENPIVKHG